VSNSLNKTHLNSSTNSSNGTSSHYTGSYSIHSAPKSNSDSLGVTAFLSMVFHAVLILGIGFNMPSFLSKNAIDNTLDVVIVNQSNDIEPTDAELVSQANNQGGGIAEVDASTPVPFKQTSNANREQIVLKTSIEKSVERLSKDVLTIKGKNEFNKVVEQKEQQQQRDIIDQKINTRNQIRLEKKRLAAKIAKNWSEYQKRPKREFYSPNTKKSDSAAYVRSWQRKVERVGSANFPEEIRRKKLKGVLIVDVAINEDGTIRKVNIIRSSGNKLLDDTTVRFIRLASPYRPFSKSMKKRIDIIHITRAYYLSGGKLVSESITN